MTAGVTLPGACPWCSAAMQRTINGHGEAHVWMRCPACGGRVAVQLFMVGQVPPPEVPNPDVELAKALACAS